MNAQLTFFAVGCAAVAVTGCHPRTMRPQGPGSATVKITASQNIASVDRDELDIDFGSNQNFTVTWQAPDSKAWLVEFDPRDSPCQSRLFIIQKGVQENCIINKGDIQDNHYYEYVVFADAAHSRDPRIMHNAGQAPPPKRPAIPPFTLFCLDLSKASPTSCNNDDPPTQLKDANPLTVSPLDDIYFQVGSNWSVAVDAGVCEQTQISSSSQPYCTVKEGASRPSPYNYRVTVNGTTKGPFQIQVK